MKKMWNWRLLVSAVVCVAASGAMAEPIEMADGKVSLNGQVRVRYEYANNYDFATTDDDRQLVMTRVRPTLTLKPHPDLRMVVQPQFAGGWGEDGSSLSSTNATALGGLSGSGLNDPTFGLHQGYLDWQASDTVSMRLGRQEINYGDQLVVGSVGWHNTGRAFDAGKLRYDNGRFWIDGFWSVLSDDDASRSRGAPPTNTGVAQFGGLYSSFNVSDYLPALDVYALYRFDNSSLTVTRHNYVTAGLRAKGGTTSHDFRFESNYQLGKIGTANQREYSADLEVGTHLFGDTTRIALEGVLASEGYQQLFPTAHKWMGFMDLFGRRNTMAAVFHLSAKPAEQWKIGLDAHTLWRYKTSSGLFALNGATQRGAGAGGRFAGEEIDLTVKYQANDMLDFSVGGGVFIPAGFMKANVGTKMPMWSYAQANLKF